MRNKSTISTLLPFQGVNGFTNDNPTQGAASLALATRSIGLSARPWKSKIRSTPKIKPQKRTA